VQWRKFVRFRVLGGVFKGIHAVVDVTKYVSVLPRRE
jgi:hypothetical protein